MMAKFTNKILAITFVLAFVAGIQQVFAQEENVTTELTTHSSDAIFSSTASYTFDVHSTYNKTQSGTVKYVVTTEAGKKMKSDSVHVNIGPRSSASYSFDISGLQSGFYKVNFMINVSDYDDTTRRAFGIRPHEVRSQHAKPSDFETFWNNSKAELAKVDPEFTVTEMPDSSKDNRNVYLVEMKSLGGLTIRG